MAGIALAIVGATRANAWLLRLHIATAVIGSVLVLGWMFATVVRRARPGETAGTAVGLSVLGAILLATGILVVKDRREAPQRYRIANPALPPETMEGEGAGPKSPFFPSSAQTNVGGTIPSNFFMTSQTCGRCHEEIYKQWNSSAHHFSSFNNQWYRKSIEYMQDVVGTQPSKWCAGCHDHAVFFNGRFDRPIKEQIDTPEAQAGLSCTSCHSIVHVGSTMGQGDFTIEYPPLHDLAASENPVLSRVHDYLLYTDPEPHRRTFLKSFHREQTAQFCASCHKVHLDVPVNEYRWFRGFNEYDNWQASGVSGEGARSFYYPAKPQKCADCHMPLVAAKDPAAREREGPLASLPRRQHRAALRERRRRAAQGHAGLPARRPGLGGRLRPGPGRGGGAGGRGRGPGSVQRPRRRAAARQHVRAGRGIGQLRYGADRPEPAGRGDRARSTR